MIWYIGLPAVLLEAFRLAVLAKRCGRAVLAGGTTVPTSPGDSIPPAPLADS